jgi:Ca2+-transporting ATPase
VHLKNVIRRNTLLDRGLSEKEARKNLQEYGLNILSEKKKTSAISILLSQFNDYMVLILLACTAISAFMGEMIEAYTIIAIVILNASLGFIQEFRTEKTLVALKELSAPVARVLRDGKKKEIPAEEVVPGDIIILEAGDRVPADAIVVEMNRLQLNESLLTGESVPVEKGPAGENIINDRSLYKDSCKVFLGTIVTSGRAKAYVFATGMFTEMGKIANLLQDSEDEQTPLQKRLDHLGKIIAIGCLVICATVAVAGVLRGEKLLNMLLAGISLAVAAVPEGLPAIVTVALALGVRRMLRRNSLVRRLPAVETLGSASVICSDKTGTLTENKMQVRKVYVDGETYDFGDLKTADQKENSQLRKAYTKLLEIGALCNNASFSSEGQLLGDPTEGSLLLAADEIGLSSRRIEKEYKRISEIPFDSGRKCMSVVCSNKSGEDFVFTKGAPDVIINKCSKIYIRGEIRPLTQGLKRKVMAANDSMAGEALRVLGLAYKPVNKRLSSDKEFESDLIFTGLTGIMDPPRKEAALSILKCKLAGIKTVMITGDHKLTAEAIARELGILEGNQEAVTGAELDKMSDRQLAKIVAHTAVYARVSPGHKLRIVKALKGLGHIVAMTGDGVNDAPAVREADIGVAMGISGTDVTKEASDMILLDDNFSTIVAAVEEGRVIYNNIRKFIRYMLSCNLGEVLTMFLGMLMGLPIPLLPIQILWVNLVTDGLPAMALGFDPPESDVMKMPPRKEGESIFAHGLHKLIIVRGMLIGLSSLTVFTLLYKSSGDVRIARTGCFITLVMTQLIHVFECKSERKSILKIPLLNNKLLLLAVACSITMLLVVVYIPVLQVMFRTAPLGIDEWLLILSISFLVPILHSFTKAG